jgi:hypothetical protein
MSAELLWLINVYRENIERRAMSMRIQHIAESHVYTQKHKMIRGGDYQTQ